MLSLVLIYVINVQSFGWTIQFHFPVGFLIQSRLLILAVTALAGLYPASRAAKIEAVRFAEKNDEKSKTRTKNKRQESNG